MGCPETGSTKIKETPTGSCQSPWGRKTIRESCWGRSKIREALQGPGEGAKKQRTLVEPERGGRTTDLDFQLDLLFPWKGTEMCDVAQG